MRVLIVACLTLAVAVAVGVGFSVGFLDLTTENSRGIRTISLAIDTNMVPLPGTRVEAAAQGSLDNLVDVKGKVTAVRPEKNELVVSENVKNWTFRLGKEGKVLINDRESKLADVQAGDDAMVTFDRQAQELIATVVRCTRK